MAVFVKVSDSMELLLRMFNGSISKGVRANLMTRVMGVLVWI